MIIIPGMIFVNKKNKETYSALYLSKLKLNGEWVDAVTYINISDSTGTKYTREVDDFVLKFRYVES
jgi:hypothetical protein